MKEKSTIITISKGQQITIPAEYREDFGLKAGSKVEIIRKNKKIIIQPLSEDLDQLFEGAKKIKPKYSLTAKQMDEAVENEIY